MARFGILLPSVVAAVQIVGLVPGESAFAQSPAAAQHPLMVVEQQRSSIVQRIVSDWSDTLATLPKERSLTAQQLSTALWTLRADRLFAASLAGSFTAIEDILAEDDADRAGPQRVTAKNLGDAAADLTYTPINPCRIADTRAAGGALVANTPRTFDGFSANFATQGGTASNCGMPNGVAAIAMNVYAVNPTNLGFIKVYPANAAEPAVSTVNYQTGVVAIATGAIVPVDSAHSNRFIGKSSARVDFIVDVVGYFRAPLGLGNYFVQGGNGFGATAVLGTKDANALELNAGNARAIRYEPNAISPNVIGGHALNNVTPGVVGATIGGGGGTGSRIPNGSDDIICNVDSVSPCANRVTDAFGTIGGGLGNQTGNGNSALTGPAAATVGGGVGNTASLTASTVAGGQFNTAGELATVGGGGQNSAGGFASTVAGGQGNTANGPFSFAAGYLATIPFSAHGSFLWSDPTFPGATLPENAHDEFVVASTGGIGMYTSKTFATGCFIAAAGGSWSCTSDRAQKTDITAIDPRDVLERLVGMPVAKWRFRGEPPTMRHIGPMAQDFHASFGLGGDDKSIAGVDADGIAFSAIQGLNAKLEEQSAVEHAELIALRREMAELRQAVEVLMTRTDVVGRVAHAR